MAAVYERKLCEMCVTGRIAAPVQAGDAEAWHIQYRQDAVDHVGMYPSPEAAIEAACRLIDEGCDVYGIGTGPLTDSIGQKEIARIYDLWADAKPGHKSRMHAAAENQSRSDQRSEFTVDTLIFVPAGMATIGS